MGCPFAVTWDGALVENARSCPLPRTYNAPNHPSITGTIFYLGDTWWGKSSIHVSTSPKFNGRVVLHLDLAGLLPQTTRCLQPHMQWIHVSMRQVGGTCMQLKAASSARRIDLAKATGHYIALPSTSFSTAARQPMLGQPPTARHVLLLLNAWLRSTIEPTLDQDVRVMAPSSPQM